jgi:hypothetical protein
MRPQEKKENLYSAIERVFEKIFRLSERVFFTFLERSFGMLVPALQIDTLASHSLTNNGYMML